MNLLKRFLSKLRPEPALLPEDNKLRESVEAVLAPPVKPPEPARPKGRIVKQTKSAVFNPGYNRRGGRIVKVMPRELQKIKQAQEKVEDDEQPTIED